MSPEYAMEGLFSVKSDVYSFGILVLEIVSGRRNNSFHNRPNTINIVGHVSISMFLFNFTDSICSRHIDSKLFSGMEVVE